jgi:hypothetical protein
VRLILSVQPVGLYLGSEKSISYFHYSKFSRDGSEKNSNTNHVMYKLTVNTSKIISLYFHKWPLLFGCSSYYGFFPRDVFFNVMNYNIVIFIEAHIYPDKQWKVSNKYYDQGKTPGLQSKTKCKILY